MRPGPWLDAPAPEQERLLFRAMPWPVLRSGAWPFTFPAQAITLPDLPLVDTTDVGVGHFTRRDSGNDTVQLAASTLFDATPGFWSPPDWPDGAVDFEVETPPEITSGIAYDGQFDAGHDAVSATADTVSLQGFTGRGLRAFEGDWSIDAGVLNVNALNYSSLAIWHAAASSPVPSQTLPTVTAWPYPGMTGFEGEFSTAASGAATLAAIPDYLMSDQRPPAPPANRQAVYWARLREVHASAFVARGRYRFLFAGAGRWRLRQRQSLTGTDGWPLRQRQNGANSGSWPLRQRQHGV